ncbi:MAG: hypothetical protein NWF14_03665 [Candidatus Bathyarchaeota archaeon]|nr:hypothetical protein [Candidatus Bathyarchaeota archaeon]
MEKLKRLHFLLRKIVRSSQSPRTVKVCPRCRSLNIKFSSKMDVWLTPSRYVCENCGYMGPIVMEIEKVEEET